MNLLVTSVNPAFDIVVGSKSKTKVRAVEAAFAKYMVNMVVTEARSGISSEPVDNETFVGACNRIKEARARHLLTGHNADFLVVGIENGIFAKEVNGKKVWLDKAVVIVEPSGGKQYVRETSPVLLPAECVAIAQKRGFENTTVGQVMSETDSTVQHDDPHSSLPPFKSRQEYLEEALLDIVNTLEQEKVLEKYRA